MNHAADRTMSARRRAGTRRAKRFRNQPVRFSDVSNGTARWINADEGLFYWTRSLVVIPWHVTKP